MLLQVNAWKHADMVKRLLKLLFRHQNGEEMWSDFDHVMIVDASMSETVDFLGFSQPTASKVCIEWCEKWGAVLWTKWERWEVVNERWEENGQTGASWLEGYRNTNEVDGLQQQRTTQGSTPVSQEQETEVTVGTGSPKLDSRTLEKC